MSKHGNHRRRATTVLAPFDPSAARGTLGQAFLRAIMEDFERYGTKQLKWLRRRRPNQYFQLIAALLPKEYRIKDVETPALEALDDEEFFAIFDKLKELVAQDREGRQYVAAIEAEEAAELAGPNNPAIVTARTGR